MFFFTTVMRIRHNVRRPGVRCALATVPAAALMAAAVIGAAACGGGASAGANQQITVSAAVSLQDVLTELGRDFEKSHPGTRVDFNFGASGDLERQIISGAPVDVFASASTQETDDLGRRGLIVNGTLVKPVTNSVVLVEPVRPRAPVTSFQDLTKESVEKIAVGDPATVPAGRYARDTLTYLGLWEPLGPKLVFGGSVRQVLDYVARGEVDAGIVYATDARIRANQVKTAAAAPAASHPPVVYPMAVLSASRDRSLSRQFLDYLTSPAARPVFERYGFGMAS